MRPWISAPLLAALLATPCWSEAAPLSVAGFEFPDGEDDFAKSASVVSGTVTGSSDAQVNSVLTGSYVGDSIRVITPDVAVVELEFDRTLVNAPGADAIVFELSGAALAGTVDDSERFEVSVLKDGAFTSFQVVDPVSTGYVDPADSTLNVFAVQLDLDVFGLGPGTTSNSIRIRLTDNLTGTRSADPTAVGLLHSVPEPGITNALLSFFLVSQIALLRRPASPN